jgi:hypothetical protein
VVAVAADPVNIVAAVEVFHVAVVVVVHDLARCLAAADVEIMVLTAARSLISTPVHQHLQPMAAWPGEGASWAAHRYLEQQKQVFVVEEQARIYTCHRQTGFVLAEEAVLGGSRCAGVLRANVRHHLDAAGGSLARHSSWHIG